MNVKGTLNFNGEVTTDQIEAIASRWSATMAELAKGPDGPTPYADNKPVRGAQPAPMERCSACHKILIHCKCDEKDLKK